MNVKRARIVADNAWVMASKFRELSPTAQKVFSAMGGVNYEKPKSWLGRWIAAKVRKILCWRLDKLILIDDASVRVMALKAMEALNYPSKHIGLIATLYVSEEIGHTLNEAGEQRSAEGVSDEVWSYFLNLLDIPYYFKDLQRTTDHWEMVLSIDYTKEYSVEDSWDLSGKEPVRIHRDVPLDEVGRRLINRRKEILGLYRHDLDKLTEKKLAGYYEQRQAEVYKCVEEIIRYLFQQKLDDKTIAEALGMLAWIARAGHFPEKWRLELSQKYATQ